MQKLLVPLVLIALGLVGLLVAGIAGGTPEIQAREIRSPDFRDRTVLMHGLLADIESADRPLRFTIRDKEKEDVLVPVYADNTRPDTFQRNFDIAVEGRWDEGRQVFVADRILTKCPSKYEDEAKQGIGSGYLKEKHEGAPAEEAPAATPEPGR